MIRYIVTRCYEERNFSLRAYKDGYETISFEERNFLLRIYEDGHEAISFEERNFSLKTYKDGHFLENTLSLSHDIYFNFHLKFLSNFLAFLSSSLCLLGSQTNQTSYLMEIILSGCTKI